MYVCTYVCMYVSVYVCLLFIYLLCVCMRLYEYMYICVCIFVCMYVCILPILQYGAPIWKSALTKASYKTKLIRVQRLMNIKRENLIERSRTKLFS